MTSLRHNAYLDAARDAILEVGWKRTTLTDVARRAEVSRMTIYRTWPDMQTLLADLLTREWGAVVARVEVPAEPTARSIADAIVTVVQSLRTDPLFRRTLDLDPELVLPYLLDRRGRSQQGVLALVTEQVRRGQAAGAVRAGDPALLARTVLLTAQGLTLSVMTMADEGFSTADLDADYAELLARGLAP